MIFQGDIIYSTSSTNLWERGIASSLTYNDQSRLVCKPRDCWKDAGIMARWRSFRWRPDPPERVLFSFFFLRGAGEKSCVVKRSLDGLSEVHSAGSEACTRPNPGLITSSTRNTWYFNDDVQPSGFMEMRDARRSTDSLRAAQTHSVAALNESLKSTVNSAHCKTWRSLITWPAPNHTWLITLEFSVPSFLI